MIPVATPAEMRAADGAAADPIEVLVARAGAAVARAGLALIGGGYGRRVVVVAGKGNNGADGRDAATRLARRGVRTVVYDAADAPTVLPPADLVIDAAYGTGFRGSYRAPDPGLATVLAVDIPSGVDGLTGQAGDGAVRADATVTFAALKPGLVLHPGCDQAGSVTVVDIGLAVGGTSAWVLERSDIAGWLPRRSPQAHKWGRAVWVVAGSPGLTGAANLCAAAAQRAGSGMVLLGVPGGGHRDTPAEVVTPSLPAAGWDGPVMEGLARVKALAVGPGLGRSVGTTESVRRLVGAAAVPVVVDADGLAALGDARSAAEVVARRQAPTVLTPHAGEFARLSGAAPGADRLASARSLARATGATVLLKGSPSIAADPDGTALIATQGDDRLATAGTGDVLTGIVAAFLAGGLDGLRAAGAAMFVHGLAGRLGSRRGLVARDLLDLLPGVLDPLDDEVHEVNRWR